MTDVKIFSTPTCPWCKKAKKYFKKKKIKFTDIDVAEDDKAREEMVEKTGQMGVPVIEIGETVIVGFDEKKIEEALKKK